MIEEEILYYNFFMWNVIRNSKEKKLSSEITASFAYVIVIAITVVVALFIILWACGFFFLENSLTNFTHEEFVSKFFACKTKIHILPSVVVFPRIFNHL